MNCIKWRYEPQILPNLCAFILLSSQLSHDDVAEIKDIGITEFLLKCETDPKANESSQEQEFFVEHLHFLTWR